jgi:hypothetical protein
MSVLFRVAAGLGLDAQTEALQLDDAKSALASAFHDREEAFERVLLVSSAEVIDAARGWVREIYAMRSLVESVGTTKAAWQAQVTQTNAARNAFYAAARSDLGTAL